MSNTFGLASEDLECILSLFESTTEIEEAFIFGSRAKGNYRQGSDVDIALKGPEVNHLVKNRLSYLLNEETMMPFHFDVIDMNSISNPDFAEHIKKVDICIYSKQGKKRLA